MSPFFNDISESKSSKKSGGRRKGRGRNNKSGSGGKSRTSSRLANKKISSSVAAALTVNNQKKRLASSDLDAEGSSFAKTPKMQCKRDLCSTPTSTSAKNAETSSNNGRNCF